MKHCRKILSVLLVFTMVALLFVSCGKKKGEIIAVYNNTPVYESEVSDIINYQLTVNYTPNFTEAILSSIMQEAVREYVEGKVLELALKEKGISVDEKALKSLVESTRAEINATVEGGYEKWKQTYNVSDAFLAEHLRRQELTKLYEKEAIKDIEVSEDALYNYYLSNSMNYAAPAGYTWTAVFRELLNVNDAAECANAEAELKDYIAKLNNGSITLETVQNEILAKYTSADGYKYGNLLSGTNFASLASVTEIENLEATLADIAAKHGNLVYSDSMTEEEKNAYMAYVSEAFRAELFYALQNTAVGSVYVKPIKNTVGYYIVRLDSVSTTSGFKAFDDVKDEIKEILVADDLEAKYSEYLNDLITKYDVMYSFS